MIRFTALPVLAVLSVLVVPAVAGANPGRDAILAELSAQAKDQASGFAGFDAGRGDVLFRHRHTGGKPATPACTSCHGPSPIQAGETRAGKVIDPLAVSRTPERYSDPEKVAKWFRRNCNSVLGRECTAREKGDFITFMTSQ